MCADSYTVVDADAHYMDHMDDMYEYLDDDDPWKDRFRGEMERRADAIGAVWPKDSGPGTHSEFERSDFHSRQDVLDAMDDLGVDKILLIGQQMLNIPSGGGMDKRAIKYTEAYVEYLLDTIADPDNGIYITIPVVHTDVDKTAEHIDRWGDEAAVAGVCVVPKFVEPPFGDRKYDPLYAACERNDLPVIFHSAGSAVDQYHLEGFQTNLATNHLGFLVTGMNTLTSVIIRGVPERFPDLDIVFEETGLFYIPLMMYRLDMYYLMMPDDAPLLEKLPSEYMKDCYFGTQPIEHVPDPKYLQYVFEMIGGVDNLLYATDWPHLDYDEQNAITDLSFLSEEEKAQILGKNAEEVFGI
jgi:predicted TIM-barrel fold metal-dependent hydrolase